MTLRDEVAEESPGTLDMGEYHPAAISAIAYIKRYLANNLMDAIRLKESFDSCAMSGNRLGEVCGETLRRIMEGEPVSDRYLLGLAWTMREMEKDNK